MAADLPSASGKPGTHFEIFLNCGAVKQGRIRSNFTKQRAGILDKKPNAAFTLPRIQFGSFAYSTSETTIASRTCKRLEMNPQFR